MKEQESNFADYQRATNACNKRIRQISLHVLIDIINKLKLPINISTHEAYIEEYLRLFIKNEQILQIPIVLQGLVSNELTKKQEEFLKYIKDLDHKLTYTIQQKRLTFHELSDDYNKALNIISEEAKEKWGKLPLEIKALYNPTITGRGLYNLSNYNIPDNYTIYKLIYDRKYPDDENYNEQKLKEYDEIKANKNKSHISPCADITNDKIKLKAKDHFSTHKKIKKLYDYTIIDRIFPAIFKVLAVLTVKDKVSYKRIVCNETWIKEYYALNFITHQEYILFYFFYKLLEHQPSIDEETQALIDLVNYLEALSIVDKVKKNPQSDTYNKERNQIKKETKAYFVKMPKEIKDLYQNEHSEYANLVLASNYFAVPDKGWTATIKDYVTNYIPEVANNMSSMKSLVSGMALGGIGSSMLSSLTNPIGNAVNAMNTITSEINYKSNSGIMSSLTGISEIALIIAMLSKIF